MTEPAAPTSGSAKKKSDPMVVALWIFVALEAVAIGWFIWTQLTSPN